MPKGYKIRLPDGSEIGPMELQAVKDWYAQGLIGKNDLVLPPTGTRWIPLARAINLQEARRLAASPAGASPELRAAVARAAGSRPAVAKRAAPASPPLEVQKWRTILGGILLFLGAGGATAWTFVPDRWLPALDATPWKEIALGQLALGLLLIRGWELGRKLVRMLVLLGGCALFPVAGMLLGQGVRGRALLVVASAALLALGFFGLLSGAWLSGFKTAFAIATVLAGWGGVVYFGLVPATEELRRIREWASLDHRFVDPNAGVALELPESWLVLRSNQTLVAAPAGTRLVFAQPRLGGLGFLMVGALPDGSMSLDEHLSRVLHARALTSRQEVGRSDVLLGKLMGRRVVSTWEREGVRFRDVVVAAKDGRTSWTLVGWVPDDGSSQPAREMEALVNGLALSGAMAHKLEQAVESVLRDVPHLSPQAAEMILAQSEVQLLEPQEAFRRSYALVSRGLVAITASEAQELGALNAAVAAVVSRKDRTRFTAYLERVRDGRATTPAEDREIAHLVKGVVLGLPQEKLERLQALYEKAIRAAITAG